MKYFFDTEFNENVNPIEIISIGVVAEDGREFYGIIEGYSMGHRFSEEPKTRDDYPHLWSCNDWVIKNVLPILYLEELELETHIGREEYIKNSLIDFVGMDPSPEFWAYYGDYDWFLLTRMFKSFDRMPSKWPQIAYDLHQYAKHVGVHRELPRKLEPKHNALVDARWTKQAFDKVKEMRNLRLPVNKEPVWP